jgi:hypothetical protein
VAFPYHARENENPHYFNFAPILLANGIGVVVGLLCACLYAETVALGLLLLAFAFLSLAFDMAILVVVWFPYHHAPDSISTLFRC